MAFGLFCCALLTRPASAKVTGSIDSVDLVFSNTGGQTATATSNVEWTITNTNTTSCNTNMNNKLFYRQNAPYSDYQGWSQDQSETTAPSTNPQSYTHAFQGIVYLGYAYNNQFRVDVLLSGLTGIDKQSSAFGTV